MDNSLILKIEEELDNHIEGTIVDIETIGDSDKNFKGEGAQGLLC
jgi:hypothetical protein